MIPRSFKIVGQGFLVLAWWCGALFGSAGLLAWRRGWICTALYMGSMIVTGMLVRRRNPELMEQREKAVHQGTRSFDRMFLSGFVPLAMVLPAIAGLDAVRFAWNPMPHWTLYLGIAVFIGSAILIAWVMVRNPHAETSVRIQVERGHRVVATGPYGLVRHPMYVGLILLYFAQALILGSMWALAIAGLIASLFLWRTAMEDKVLRKDLPGYEEYASMIRYRLMPGLW